MTETPFRVLVIEPACETLDLIGAVLRGAGYEYVEAVDARSGVEQALQSEPDLILVDVMTPDLNGFDLTRLLKCSPSTRRIPVVFLSAINRPVNLLRGLGSWPVEFLSKPVTPEKLLALVDRLHRTRDALIQLRELGSQARAPEAVADVTGPLMRKLLERQLSAQLRHLTTNQVPAACIQLKVDKLELIGRGEGELDERLVERKLFALIRSVTRVEDLVASNGEKSYRILVAGTSPLAAEAVGEKILAVLDQTPIRAHDLMVKVRAKITVDHWAPRAERVRTSSQH